MAHHAAWNTAIAVSAIRLVRSNAIDASLIDRKLSFLNRSNSEAVWRFERFWRIGIALSC
jgi:hypothetical protein